MHTLTKSLFTAGLQCPKLLWWKVHEPTAVELQPDIVLKDRFDQGAQVGELARKEFPGGVLIDSLDGRDARLAKTQSAIASRPPAIFEGTFEARGIRIKADVLLPEGNGWRLIEVKSSSSQKDEHLPDAAVQAWVLRENGIEVTGVEIMHLNKEYRHGDTSSPLLLRTGVTEQVSHFISDVPDQVDRQLKILDGDLPDHAIGVHCSQPYDCPFEKRCWPANRDHISRLHSVGPVKAASYMKDGVHSVFDWKPKPNAKPSNQANTIRRQVRSLTENRLIVEPGLKAALKPFTGRLGFLDFETISRGVPVWPNMRPYDLAAAQFSYHEAQADGTYEHAAFLAEGPADARPELARQMVEATANAERVVMYTPFERTQIRSLREAVPALNSELLALEEKLIDLRPVIQDHVYHPAFEGSFSLKYVLPALVPELSYKDLVIVNGLVASVEIARLLFVSGRILPEEHDRVRQDLLDYCERDTWATVKLVETLRRLCEAG